MASILPQKTTTSPTDSMTSLISQKPSMSPLPLTSGDNWEGDQSLSFRYLARDWNKKATLVVKQKHNTIVVVHQTKVCLSSLSLVLCLALHLTHSFFCVMRRNMMLRQLHFDACMHIRCFAIRVVRRRYCDPVFVLFLLLVLVLVIVFVVIIFHGTLLWRRWWTDLSWLTLSLSPQKNTPFVVPSCRGVQQNQKSTLNRTAVCLWWWGGVNLLL